MINIAGGASFCIIIIICLFIWKTCLSKGCKVVWQFKSTQAVSRTDLYNPVESAHWNGAHTISLLFVSFASFFLQTFKWTLPLQNITLTVVVASIFKNQHVTVREQYFKVLRPHHLDQILRINKANVSVKKSKINYLIPFPDFITHHDG